MGLDLFDCDSAVLGMGMAATVKLDWKLTDEVIVEEGSMTACSYLTFDWPNCGSHVL